MALVPLDAQAVAGRAKFGSGSRPEPRASNSPELPYTRWRDHGMITVGVQVVSMIRYLTGVVLLTVLTTALISAAAQTSSSQSAPPPLFHFGFALDDAGKVRQVLVYRGDQQVQALDSCTGEDVPREKGVGELSRSDYNFDGYLDLALRVSFDSEMENSSYCVWLFDPKTEQFVLSPQLSHMVNPQPDPDTKLVLARKNEDCMGHCYEQDIYSWSEGQLKLMRQEVETEDMNIPPTSQCRWILSVSVEKNGQMKEISRDRVDSAGIWCEPHSSYF